MEGPIRYYSEKEYLELELHSEHKSEFLNGVIYAMAGASEKHNIISINISSELRTQLKNKPCQVYAADMRVKVQSTGLYTYPDLLMVCPEKEFSGD